MFNSAFFENSRPDGMAVLEISPSEEAPTPPERRFVPLRRTELRGEVVGPLAALTVRQTFGFERATFDKPIEARYRFPLPGDAAVVQVRVRFGDVEIVAELKGREEAEAEYQAAKQQGFQALLTRREAADVFTLQVAGIRPDEEVVVETRYVQVARAEGSGWALRVPLTTAPRYVRADEHGTSAADAQPLALMRDPGHRASLDLLLPAVESVSSPTHSLESRREGAALRVRFAGGELLPERDLLLHWQAAQAAEQPTLAVTRHDAPDEGHSYFLAQVAPPATRDARQAVPREAILLVDHSGSMEGPKWEAAAWTVRRFLAGLGPQDHFNVAFFHNSAHWVSAAPRPATPEAIAEALRFVEGPHGWGGTELGVALEQALLLPRSHDVRARHLLLVTDAQVSDAGRILRLADEEAARDEARRISVICIDAAPNDFLAHELAARGGGVARFLTSDPEQDDIATALESVLADWAEPLLVGLQLEVNRPRVEATGQRTAQQGAWASVELGDLPAGRTLWVVGRVPRGEGALHFRLRARGHEVASASAPDGEPRPALKALFGARRILGLEYLIHARYSPEQRHEQLQRLGYEADELRGGDVTPLYAENARAASQQALGGLLRAEALRYGLPSEETAFVAVRREAGEPVATRVDVANALPSGWAGEFASGAPPQMKAAAMPTASGFVANDELRLAYRAAPTTPPKSEGLIGKLRGLLSSGDQSKASYAAQRAAGAEPAPRPSTLLFRGTPRFDDGQALLFDAAQGEAALLPAQGTLRGLRLGFPNGAPDDLGELTLLLFVDDVAQPRARVRLADLWAQGGRRPLNLRRGPGQPLRLLLSDPAGQWACQAPTLELTLEW